MILKAKDVRQKARYAGKQINKKALEILDRHIDKILTEIIVAQKEKRITDKTIQL